MKLLSEENKAKLWKRFIALLWHAGTMVLVLLVDFIADNLGLFNLPDQVAVTIGLVLAQITKWLNVK